MVMCFSLWFNLLKTCIVDSAAKSSASHSQRYCAGWEVENRHLCVNQTRYEQRTWEIRLSSLAAPRCAQSEDKKKKGYNQNVALNQVRNNWRWTVDLLKLNAKIKCKDYQLIFNNSMARTILLVPWLENVQVYLKSSSSNSSDFHP